MEIRSLSLPIEFPPGDAGLKELGRGVARLRTVRGVREASASGEKAELRLLVDTSQFSTERLEYELSAAGVRLKTPVVRRVLLLERLDSPETARAITRALNEISGVLLAKVDFATGQGRIEYLASVSPERLLGTVARFRVSARFADAPAIDRRPSLSFKSRVPDLLALGAAIVLWKGGASVRFSPLFLRGLPASPLLFALASLCAGWRPLGAALRCARQESSERNALLAICWFAGLAALGRWGEAAGSLILLRAGELALAALLTRFRSRWRDLPPPARESLSAALLPSNPYVNLLRLPVMRGLFLVGLLTAGFAVAPSLLISGLAAQRWGVWAYRGLVLLPLASSEVFYLAASAAVAAALNSGREDGLWFRGGASLKTLAGAKAAAYAKTGVLTQGNVVVEDALPYYGWTCADVLRVAAALQPDRRHPIARALREAAAPFRKVIALEASDCVAEEGGGVAGTVDDIRFFLGSRRWMQRHRVPLMRQAEEAIAFAEARGLSIALLGVEGGLLGLIVFRDTFRADATEGIAALKGLRFAAQTLISGDGASVAAQTAQAMGLEALESSAGEAERNERVAELRGRIRGPVLAVGDGAFDAALLDAADAAFCMNTAARPDAALFATIAAQNDDFSSMPRAVRFARRMDAALLRAWGLTLTAKAALLIAALLFPLPLPAMVMAEAALALLAAGFLLTVVPPRLRRTEGDVAPAGTSVESAPTVADAPAPPAPPYSEETEPVEVPEPMLELVFTCDPSADEEPTPDRVYPRWESFVVPFYGEPLRFGRKFPTLSLAVQVEDEGVSRLHGEVRLDEARPVIVDLRSTNGIRHNSKGPKALIAAETPAPIKFGDTLYVGRNTRIEVRAPQ